MKRLTVLLAALAVVLVACNGSASEEPSDTAANSVEMTVVLEITEDLTIGDYAPLQNLLVVRGTEPLDSVYFGSSESNSARGVLFLVFRESVIRGVGASSTNVYLNREQMRQLLGSPMGTQIVVAYKKLVPPLMSQSLKDETGSYRNSQYLEVTTPSPLGSRNSGCPSL